MHTQNCYRQSYIPPSITNLQNALCISCSHFLNGGSLLSDNPSLCQVDLKLTSRTSQPEWGGGFSLAPLLDEELWAINDGGDREN